MVDAVLLFPPQWSPFHPPLGVPSLSAWLKRDGHSVRALDLNIGFYNFLAKSSTIHSILADFAESSPRATSTLHELAIALLEYELARGDFESMASRFGIRSSDATGSTPVEDWLFQYHRSIRNVEAFLRAISAVSPFQISTFGVRFGSDTSNIENRETLDRLLDAPPPVITKFVKETVELLQPYDNALVGISCIGFDQLVFSLLVGVAVKQAMMSMVVLGGTVGARLFERASLPDFWFGKYFDYIVCHEGERPMSALLGAHDAGTTPGVIVKKCGKITMNPPERALHASEVPTPDFGDFPLSTYLAPRLTLPILSTRGCYWGRCEFCHHGMVYQDKFSMDDANRIKLMVNELRRAHSVACFSFMDEAIPPHMIRRLGEVFDDSDVSRLSFGGLMKFESIFSEKDFVNLRRVGFKTLFCGLESASEKVLAAMNKPSRIADVDRNITDISHAGLWLHCFVMFGFPGETDLDARETLDFVAGRPLLIHSAAASVFLLEHGSPMFKKLGIKANNANAKIPISLYYPETYDATVWMRSQLWAKIFNLTIASDVRHARTNWIPRDALIALLSICARDQLVEWSPPDGEIEPARIDRVVIFDSDPIV
jgi:anaerobic magnesium-protoporphyrin IX monomethyl ester cyclase